MRHFLKLIDCSFDFMPEFDHPAQVMKCHAAGLGYTGFAAGLLDVWVIEQIGCSGQAMSNGARFCFFRGNVLRKLFPWHILSFIRGQHPDVVLVQGLIFPVQVILLRLCTGRKCRIMAQHHGEPPGGRLKRVLQRAADKCIDTYLFTAHGNAREWIRRRIIPGYGKCREILEGSTSFQRKDAVQSRSRCGISGGLNLLWVGRLNRNKDPVTVLTAFKALLAARPDARLYMIYREKNLPPEMRSLLDHHPHLQKAVRLVGEVPHEALPFWYTAADFYISGSHSEGSGFALLEAMACGCIPLVTDIPSFRKITGNGQYGFLYPPGDVQTLFSLLTSLPAVDRADMSAAILGHFSRELSFKSIAEGIAIICHDLANKRMTSRAVSPAACSMTGS